jgi:hypothetical protein
MINLSVSFSSEHARSANIIYASRFAMEVYPNSFLVIFALCGWTVGHNFKVISEEVGRYELEMGHKTTEQGMKLLVKKWKKDYNAARYCADRFVTCFGLLLLIESICIFAGAIIQSFHVLITLIERNGVDTFSLALLLVHLLHLWIFGYISDKIRFEVCSFQLLV